MTEAASREVRTLAAALAGDRDVLEGLLQDPGAGELARGQRAAPALALRARAAGLDGPALAAWHRDLRAAAARHGRLAATTAEVAAALAGSGVAWAPIKGYDLATRVYDLPEERPTADLDVLVRAGDLDSARRALDAAGFRATAVGPRRERYLVEEGYAWPAASPAGVLVEVHFRLWGAVPATLPAALWRRARPDPGLPPGGHRLDLADAYLLAAVHAWLVPPPRDVMVWRDLARLAAALGPGAAGSLAERVRAFGLQLPVALAAAVSAELWGEELDVDLARRSAAELRPTERWLAARARRRGLAAQAFAPLRTAALAAGRRGRHGLARAVLRRLWPHPGIVETSTPAAWPWLARRWWYELQLLRQGVRR